MSLLAEGTISLPTELKKAFEKVCQTDIFVKDVKAVIEKKDKTIFTLDFSGYSEDLVNYVTGNGGIFEIDYLDGDKPYTVTCKGDSDKSLFQLLKLSKAERQFLKYSH